MQRQTGRWRWRPEPGWLWLSLLGMTTGAFVGAVLSLVVVVGDAFGAGVLAGDSAGYIGAILGLGVFGALLGGGVGLVLGSAVGVGSAVVAGLVAVWFRAQLPRPAAEERTSRPGPSGQDGRARFTP